jgi:hypothetical protein
MAYNSKIYQPTEDTHVIDEPAVLYKETTISKELNPNGKYSGLLDKLLQLGIKQCDEGDTITHEEFLLQRKLGIKY